MDLPPNSDKRRQSHPMATPELPKIVPLRLPISPPYDGTPKITKITPNSGTIKTQSVVRTGALLAHLSL